jgi:hypothetical protein
MWPLRLEPQENVLKSSGETLKRQAQGAGNHAHAKLNPDNVLTSLAVVEALLHFRWISPHGKVQLVDLLRTMRSSNVAITVNFTGQNSLRPARPETT